MDDFATGYLAGQDGGNNNGGFFGNEGLWAVIILAIIFGWGNYGKVAKMYSVDNTNFYADMAAAFLQDKDAVDGKLVEYWERIVERG